MKRQRPSSLVPVLGVQAVAAVALAVSLAVAAPQTRHKLGEVVTGRQPAPRVTIARNEPLVIAALYDDPTVVSYEELAAVLRQIQPRFRDGHLSPNHVEHALRTWGVNATFHAPDALSGIEMRDFLIDYGKYLANWGEETKPLLVDEEDGVAVRWGKETGASYHHDHWLASLTEAGIRLDERVFTPTQSTWTAEDVLQQALRDLRLDERETEWSALAFGLWLPPEKTWTANDGRQLSFDLIVRRLLRGQKELGVCSGTHRVYSLMALIRLDDEFDILSDADRADAYAYLEDVRDLITVSQFPDGHWPSNWPDGKDAVDNPIEDEIHKQVIATGHHLEWLAIAPHDLHPPHEQIQKAARWVIDTTVAQSHDEILDRYTFFSHVGNALALWRQRRPGEFWQEWEAEHPQTPIHDEQPEPEAAL